LTKYEIVAGKLHIHKKKIDIFYLKARITTKLPHTITLSLM